MKNAFHRGLGRATEPQVLFPLIAVLLLTVIWGITLVALKVRHSDDEHAAVVSSREFLGTYEAQVLRVMREIDQTLKLVKFWPERAAGRHTLSDFKDKELLPSDLLFTVSIVDVNGRVVESTRTTELESVADQGAFRKQRDSDVFFVGPGLLGTDGVFRVRRSGESLISGDEIDHTTTVAGRTLKTRTLR